MVTFLVQRRFMPRNSEFHKRALRGYKKLEEEKERGKGRGKKSFLRYPSVAVCSKNEDQISTKLSQNCFFSGRILHALGNCKPFAIKSNIGTEFCVS